MRYYSDLVDAKHLLYRYYDSEGELLYVGITINLAGREAKHRRRAWWPLVADVHLEEHPGRVSALAAERAAIHHEKPIYNISRPRLEPC